jgi:4-hydroxybenzoate polyprenyltransferase
VDLDGTLLATDLLWESILRLAPSRPLDLLRLPLWIAGGKAQCKRRICERVEVEPETLPYRPEVLDLLRREKAEGRRILLTTASDERLAEPIARHLGLFEAVIGSDGERNLSGGTKLQGIRDRLGDAAFDYIGDSRKDLPVWEAARRALVANPTRGILRAAARVCAPIPVSSPTRTGGRIRHLIRALRPQQWIKNVLLLVPLLLAHELLDGGKLFAAASAFVAFSLCASGGYVINDLLDLEADRRHPRKRNRPFASGALSIPLGLALLGSLVAGGMLLSILRVGLPFTGMLALYLVLTLSYSLYFKEKLFVDVLLLSGLYVHRVVAGAVATQVVVSPWLLAFSLFFFVSLAFVKRFCELERLDVRAGDRLRRRNYRREDVGIIQSLGPASGYLSVLVLALYISSADVVRLYATSELLWLICPVLLYWITRIWFLAGRGELPDDPVLFAARDRSSYLAGAAILWVGALAAL